MLAWPPEAGKHTSVYIDNPEWKEAISQAGSKQMLALSEGDWGVGRWGDPLDAANEFARDSGLQDDSSRAELLSSVQTVMGRCGITDEAVAMLCMWVKVSPSYPRVRRPERIGRVRW
ncbi:MAG: hypothetical protein Ct9H300mP30_4000 [Methanobacteriota archaeon]|nr:MAG: hypothetical protein Ct9H300mP30_4000 [Euryarchaeota archaeon]